MKCKGRYCASDKVRRVKGKGSFAGYMLWICNHCGQIVRMEKI